MAKEYDIPNLFIDFDFETKGILNQLNKASRKLTKLKDGINN